MEFQDLIRKRFSVRGYKSDPVEDEKLQKVLEAATIAPTAANRQPFQLIVIKTACREEELARIYGRDWFIQAPYVICICTIPDEGWVRQQDGANYAVVDAAIAMDHLILAAHDLGLGTCWIAHFDIDAAREILALPKTAQPLIFTPLGYPNAQPRETKRKMLNDLVRYEKW